MDTAAVQRGFVNSSEEEKSLITCNNRTTIIFLKLYYRKNSKCNVQFVYTQERKVSEGNT